MHTDTELVWELLSLADHAAADAAEGPPDVGPDWRITYQPDGEGVSRIDDVGFVRFFDETGGWL